MGLGDAQLPGQARVLDGGAGGCTGAVVTGDEDDLRAALGNTGGNGADTGLADQLHVDVGVAVGVLQVIDQLGQILDGVDVVVGRGRDQAHAGGAVAGLGDPGVDLGRLPPSPGFAPCASLIWISSAETRYLLVTPKRAEATCLILELLSLW